MPAMRRPATLLRLHFDEHDMYGGRPLYEAVVEKCGEMGIAGATVFRGLEGFGESADIHRRRLVRRDQPIIVAIVDSADNIARLVPALEPMIASGLMALSEVECIRIGR